MIPKGEFICQRQRKQKLKKSTHFKCIQNNNKNETVTQAEGHKRKLTESSNCKKKKKEKKPNLNMKLNHIAWCEGVPEGDDEFFIFALLGQQLL